MRLVKEKDIGGDAQKHPGWIGVDLDGTLAFYDQFRGADHIGPPIPRMVARVQQWLSAGKEVRVFTARASDPQPERLAAFLAAWLPWSREHIGVELQVTATKDFAMLELWDDRAVSVVKNTGIALVLDG